MADTDDISLLPVEKDIQSCIQERYKNQRAISQIGSNTLLVLHPVVLKDSPSLQGYAAKVFGNMLQTNDNQSVAILGASGSGKSAARAAFQQELVNLALNPKRKSKVLSGATKMETVLSSFGHYKNSTHNASAYGRYTEYQYTREGRMVGVKILEYGFNRGRVSNCVDLKDGFRNFNIFYEMLGGLDETEKNDLGLADHSLFAYTKGVNGIALQRSGTLGRLTLGRSKSLSRSKSTSGKQAHVDSVPTNEDVSKFAVLREHMKSLGIGSRTQAQIYRVLAGILHLGNIVFVDIAETNANSQQISDVKNPDVLNTVANLLSVNPEQLKNTILYKSKVLGKDTFSVCLNAEQASKHRDSLAQTVYVMLFTWIIEHVNKRLTKKEGEFNNFIAVTDLPSITTVPEGSYSVKFDTLYANYCTEKLFHYVQASVFEDGIETLTNQGLRVPPIAYAKNEMVISLFDGTDRVPGLWTILENNIGLPVTAESTFGQEVTRNLDKSFKSNPSYYSSYDCNTVEKTQAGFSKSLFGIKHYGNLVPTEYDVESFYEEDAVMADFVSLFRNGRDINVGTAATESTFVANLFSLKNGLEVVNDGRRGLTRKKSMLRRPSMKGKSADQQTQSSVDKSNFSDCKNAASVLIETLSKTRRWDVYCINPKDSNGYYNADHVSDQFQHYNLQQLANFRRDYNIDPNEGITYDKFLETYQGLLTTGGLAKSGNSMEQVKTFVNSQWWPARDVLFGGSQVFLASERLCWLSSALKRLAETKPTAPTGAPEQPQFSNAAVESWDHLQNSGRHMDDDGFSEGESVMESEYGFIDDQQRRASYRPNTKHDIEQGKSPVTEQKPNEIIEKEEELSLDRRMWLCCTWGLTWWVPSSCLYCCGLKRPDIQIAWREKVALCIIIFLLCASLLFFIIGLRFVICPPIEVKSLEEIRAMSFARIGSKREAIFAAYGRYYDAADLMDSHKRSYGQGSGSAGAVDDYLFEEYYGEDVSFLFYKVDAWEYYCPGIQAPPDNFDNLDPNLDWQKRDRIQPKYSRIHRNLSPGRNVPQLYADNLLRYAKGRIGWSKQTIKTKSSATKPYIILFNNVYYTAMMAILNDAMFPPGFRELFGSNNQGQDITAKYNAQRRNNAGAYDQALRCVNQMFYIGTIDNRESVQCTFSNVVLFGASCVLVAVIGFKFLAALQFGSKKEPEMSDKFCILMVPCYTEGLESLSKTIDSLATMDYDDKRKLLFIICDGMIIGAGNDRPTPRLVLDLLGVDASQDPMPLAFNSLGEGIKQYNEGKVYSGLYEIRGHSVPFIVVVKCGSVTERVKPGNRGKRDSQLVLMRFLNRVHFNAEFSPMETEIYHQMKNIIGVSPTYYEFCLMVDADTEVGANSLNRFVSVMVNDAKVIGLCGETRIANEKESWVTAIQVYEYFISHHLAKAFESLFGTVTCLPGCFSIYRIRSATKHIPILVSNSILADYSENTVDTLHKKNLLHLGEDRYLTTLLLKHFPSMKTKFTAEAKCATVAPNQWSVLLSQRRRWINSTVHNLLELFRLDQLCGFCCFSMRFVVMLDLFATFVQPATVIYIAYLIYAVATSREEFPLLSLLLIASIYGLQVIIFITKREWQHIAWMFIYIAATPVIALYIPCYAFWHFDDFSWGNTRVVVGEGKKTVYVSDTEKFDPASIKMRRWKDFEENELLNDSKSVFSVATTTKSMSKYSEYSFQSEKNNNPSAFVAKNRDSMMSIGNRQSMMVDPRRIRESVSANRTSQTFMAAPSPPSIVSSNRSSLASINEVSAPMITDEVLYQEIKQALVGADLMTLTKKQIRENLGAKLGLDLRSKKEVMNKMIDDILSQQP